MLKVENFLSPIMAFSHSPEILAANILYQFFWSSSPLVSLLTPLLPSPSPGPLPHLFFIITILLCKCSPMGQKDGICLDPVVAEQAHCYLAPSRARLSVFQREIMSTTELNCPYLSHHLCLPPDSIVDFQMLCSIRFYAFTCPSVCLLQAVQHAVCVWSLECV